MINKEKYSFDKAQDESLMIQKRAEEIASGKNPSSLDYQIANDELDEKNCITEAVYDKITEGYEKATVRPLRRFAYDYTIKHYVGDLSGKKVLDLACGEGISTRMLHDLGAETVHGIDISKKQIDLARKQELPGVTYEQKDCMSEEFSTGEKFDVVSGMMFIHYAESKDQIKKVLKNVHSILADDGVFYAMTVDPDLLKNGYEKYGIRITSRGEEEGSESLIELHDFDWNKFCEFAIHRWDKNAYQEIFENEGFKVEWLKGLVAKEGVDMYGDDFWRDYLSNPPYAFIKAVKNNN